MISDAARNDEATPFGFEAPKVGDIAGSGWLIWQDMRWEDVTWPEVVVKERHAFLCRPIDPIAKPLSGAALAKSLGYTYGVDTLPACEPGYRMVRVGEPAPAKSEYWYRGRWVSDPDAHSKVEAAFYPVRVKLPTGGVVTVSGASDFDEDALTMSVPDTLVPATMIHLMRFGKTDHRVEVSKGQMTVSPSFAAGGSVSVINIAALSPDLPVETVRALILDHLGIERIADTAKAQDAEQQRTTRTQYGPGTMGEWEVNL